MSDHPMPPERPKVEPEIIPPGERGPQPRSESWVWTSSGRNHGGTVRFETRGGPLTLFTALLMLGLGAAVVLALLVGLVLLWIPVSIAIAAAILWSFLRRRP